MCLESNYTGNSTLSPMTKTSEKSRTIAAIIAIVSFLASLAVAAAYAHRIKTSSSDARMARPRVTFGRRLVVSLAFACMAFSLTSAARLSFTGDAFSCETQATVYVVFSLSYVLSMMAIALFHIFFPSRSVQSSEYPVSSYVLNAPIFLCWFLPVVVAATAIFFDALGTSSAESLSFLSVGWCWLNEAPPVPNSWTCNNARLLWMLVTLKGWELLSYALIAYSVVVNVRRFYRDDRQRSAFASHG